MFWKIYAWIYISLTLLGTALLIPTYRSWNFASWEGVIEGILLASGVFIFVYKKDLLNREFWKYVFFIILVIWIADIIFYTTGFSYLRFFETSIPQSAWEVLLSIFISIPALVAVYRLGFSRKIS